MSLLKKTILNTNKTERTVQTSVKQKQQQKQKQKQNGKIY